MKLRYKIASAVVGLLALAFFVKRGLLKDTITIPRGGEGTIVTTPNKITSVVKKGGETVRKTVPNYGHGTTINVKNGEVKVTPNSFGLPNDFGLTTTFRTIGVGTEFLYYKRLSILGGSQFLNLKTQRPQLNLWVGVGYRLPWAKLNNISIYSGINTDKEATAGLFLRLGNS